MTCLFVYALSYLLIYVLSCLLIYVLSFINIFDVVFINTCVVVFVTLNVILFVEETRECRVVSKRTSVGLLSQSSFPFSEGGGAGGVARLQGTCAEKQTRLGRDGGLEVFGAKDLRRRLGSV